ncbi:MAG TPA: bifunctional phosphoribosylaminoimidazolecarboxamide formyltransferase/IMP cyclohydrolase [Egibacteraceae bacterium]|nr:bifunctional phosphoribosylaminoimidazolecarboxamide formyltransferase/IMP cyclohydrolase [Egibacteraceae bacterium]
MSDFIRVRRALVSVYDKTGLPELARALAEIGAEIISTGSTAQAIRDLGVDVTEVAKVTGFPEILDGRVKTLHPAIHAAILADRSKESHLAALREHGIEPIDLVVVNLYPFRETIARPDVTPDEAIEMIDIGGPTMVRAAAKNHGSIAVVVNPPYDRLIEHLRSDGGLHLESRREAAAAAFAATAAYDADVRDWLHRDEAFPERYGPVFRKAQDLRYGENPHQAGAYYVERGAAWGLGSARQLGGKELSYNNILDTDAAWGMALDFTEPCAVIVKHTNPAGIAVAGSLAEAYPAALAGDPVSAFGGIVAVNRPLDAETARQIVKIFTEVVVAPGYTDEALDVLRAKANLRILHVVNPDRPPRALALRSVSGGLLVQEADVAAEVEAEWTAPTKAQPGEDVMTELRFAWKACKHTKSNAIVLAAGGAVVGVGAGQMSRVDSVRLAVEKSDGRASGAVLASDAFFPFRDGPDAALEAGVSAIIQPGGSVRDAEVIAACDERGVPMVLTGRRHFRH